MPWSVNSLAIEAGKFLLTHSEKVRINQAALLAETERLQNQLKKINKLTVYPTKTHFFLVKLPEHLAAKALKTDLAEKHQILIRDAANFVGLGSNFFRIATQTREENDILASSISFWMQEQEKGKV